MPSKKQTSRRKNAPAPEAPGTSTAVAHPPETEELFDQEESTSQEIPADVPWEMYAASDRIGFFELMKLIPESAWESDLMIYLYRLHPEVSNKEGDKKYIGKLAHAIDEDWVLQRHGGGKYHAILKRGPTETLKNVKFWIEGQPKLIEGQVLRGAPTATANGAPAPPPGGDLAGVMRELIAVVKGDPKEREAGIRVMEKAMTEGLALNSKILEKSLTSATGNSVADQILTTVLPQLLAPKTDPIVGELMKAAIEMLKKPPRTENPAPAAAAVDPMTQINNQLTFVKELTGVESIRELFDREGGARNSVPFWVTLAMNAIEKLPTLMSQFSEMQERTFQRALVAHQVRAGLPVSGMVLPPAQPATTTVQPAAAAGTSEQQAQQMIAVIVDSICRAWDEGYSGDIAGAHLKLSHPQLVEQFKPFLSDPVQLAQFVAGIAPLAERSKDPDWPEFQADLIEELNTAQIPPGATAEHMAAVPAPATAPASAEPVAVKPAKKKANGKAV